MIILSMYNHWPYTNICVFIHIWMNYTELYLFFFRPLKYVLNIHSKLLLIFFCINFLSLFHLELFYVILLFGCIWWRANSFHSPFQPRTSTHFWYIFTYYWRSSRSNSNTTIITKFNLANDHSEKFSSDYNLIKMISIQVFLLISLTTIEILAYGKQKNIPKWKKQVNNNII